MIGQRQVVLLTVAILGAALLGHVPARPALAAEGNSQGDIPDAQVFVTFRSAAGGYALDVPQGWARTTRGRDVRFTNALDGVDVVISPAATAPTVASVRTQEVPALEKAGRSVRVSQVRDARLPGGPAVFLRYTSISASDAVTGRSVRLENDAYLFFKHGSTATVTLWAPLGADNIDQWQRIACSFRW